MKHLVGVVLIGTAVLTATIVYPESQGWTKLFVAIGIVAALIIGLDLRYKKND